MGKNYFSHFTRKEINSFQQMKTAGIRFHSAGENLAAPFPAETGHARLMYSLQQRITNFVKLING